MNKKECRKCVYYGGKRKGKINCLNDRCVKENNFYQIVKGKSVDK